MDIETGVRSLKQFKNQVQRELCRGYGLEHNYNLVKSIYAIWGQSFIEKIQQA